MGSLLLHPEVCRVSLSNILQLCPKIAPYNGCRQESCLLCCFPIGRPADIELICELRPPPPNPPPIPLLICRGSRVGSDTHRAIVEPQLRKVLQEKASVGRSGSSAPNILLGGACSQPADKVEGTTSNSSTPKHTHAHTHARGRAHTHTRRDNALHSPICHLRRAPIIMYEAGAHFRRGGFWLDCCCWSERTGPSRSDPIRSDGGSCDRRLMRRADRTSNPLISLLPIPAPGRCGKRNMMFTSTFCCKSCKCCNWLTDWLLRTGDC